VSKVRREIGERELVVLVARHRHRPLRSREWTPLPISAVRISSRQDPLRAIPWNHRPSPLQELPHARLKWRFMPGEGLPDDVREAIAQHIDSVGKLEILLVLERHPTMTPEAVAGELRMPIDPVRERLDQLVRSRLVVCDDAAYGLRDETVRTLVARLAEAYAKRRVTVVELVVNRPSDSLSTFADAFKFRRKT
jgi:hypothetical protein